MNNNQQNQPKPELSFGDKVKYSFFSALIFFFVSSPMMYQFIQRIYGAYVNISDTNGCPTNSGLLLHTFIFFILILVSMLLA